MKLTVTGCINNLMTQALQKITKMGYVVNHNTLFTNERHRYVFKLILEETLKTFPEKPLNEENVVPFLRYKSAIKILKRKLKNHGTI